MAELLELYPTATSTSIITSITTPPSSWWCCWLSISSNRQILTITGTYTPFSSLNLIHKPQVCETTLIHIIYYMHSWCYDTISHIDALRHNAITKLVEAIHNAWASIDNSRYCSWASCLTFPFHDTQGNITNIAWTNSLYLWPSSCETTIPWREEITPVIIIGCCCRVLLCVWWWGDRCDPTTRGWWQ